MHVWRLTTVHTLNKLGSEGDLRVSTWPLHPGISPITRGVGPWLTSNKARPPNPVVASKTPQLIPEVQDLAGEPAQLSTTCDLHILYTAVERESNKRAFLSAARLQK